MKQFTLTKIQPVSIRKRQPMTWAQKIPHYEGRITFYSDSFPRPFPYYWEFWRIANSFVDRGQIFMGECEILKNAEETMNKAMKADLKIRTDIVEKKVVKSGIRKESTRKKWFSLNKNKCCRSVASRLRRNVKRKKRRIHTIQMQKVA